MKKLRVPPTLLDGRSRWRESRILRPGGYVIQCMIISLTRQQVRVLVELLGSILQSPGDDPATGSPPVLPDPELLEEILAQLRRAQDRLG